MAVSARHVFPGHKGDLLSALATTRGGSGKPPDLLILGGTGFLSGCLCRIAKAAGFRTWILTRGKRTVPEGVFPLLADRNDGESLLKAVAAAGVEWDGVVDCIGFGAEHGVQDVAVFKERARHLIYVSSDSVYDPHRRQFPQPVEPAIYAETGYGANKLGCERSIAQLAGADLPWTILRPPHIYGPGSALGCLPPSFRDPQLPQRILAGEHIDLAGGGLFLHQPIFVDDLANLILSIIGLAAANRGILNVPGPEIITMRAYYEAIAKALRASLRVREIPVGDYLTAHPEAAAAVCHRIYDPQPLADVGARLPSVLIEEGMKRTLQ